MGKRKNKVYTLEFKQSSAKLAATTDQSIGKTAKDLGVSISTLHGWVNKYHPEKLSLHGAGKQDNPAEENKRLRKENARLRQERDILKKAAAYFASEAL